jgi:hypothetical protein
VTSVWLPASSLARTRTSACSLRPDRSARRTLVRVLASDEAGNQTLVTRTIRLTG